MHSEMLYTNRRFEICQERMFVKQHRKILIFCYQPFYSRENVFLLVSELKNDFVLASNKTNLLCVAFLTYVGCTWKRLA